MSKQTDFSLPKAIYRRFVLALVFGLNFVASSHAQIVTDGTMGASGALPGPNFVIDNTLGTQAGANLFHSFSEFNIQLTESATFKSSFVGATDNIISRVTGGSASTINGMLINTVPGADLWLLNPNGVMVGPNASLDLTAGLRISTADYLTLSDGGRFGADISNTANNMITLAPPGAFGFLDSSVGNLTVNGAQLGDTRNELVHADITLVGANVSLESVRIVDDYMRSGTPNFSLRVASVAGPGQLAVDLLPDESLSRPEPGSLSLDNTFLFVTAGSMFFLADLMDMTSSQIVGGNQGMLGTIGDIRIFTNELDLRAKSEIRSQIVFAADPPDIFVSGSDTSASAMTMSERINIEADSRIASQGGQNSGHTSADINIYAEQLDVHGDILTKGGFSSTSGNITLNVGHALVTGNVDATGEGNIVRSGNIVVIGDSLFLSGFIGSITGLDTPITANHAGNISISVDTIEVEGGTIAAFSTAQNGGDGQITLDGNYISLKNASISAESEFLTGGSISIRASEELYLNNSSITTTVEGLIPQGIQPVEPDSTSEIRLDVAKLTLENGSTISAEALGRVDSGSIFISGVDVESSTDFSNLISVGSLSSISTSSLSDDEESGKAGSISIFVERLIANGNVSSTTEGSGNAGVIVFDAGDMEIGGEVTTSSSGTADAGRIDVRGDSLAMIAGRIASETTGTGNSGDVTVAVSVLIMDDGAISVESNLGQSGSVDIDAQFVDMSGGSIVSAESQRSSAGSIFVRAAQRLTMDGGVIRATTNAQTPAGPGDEVAEVGLDTAELRMTNESKILAETTGVRDSGSITISGTGTADDASDRTSLVQVDSGSLISTSSTTIGSNTGDAGNISIFAGQLLADGDITSSTAGSGSAGVIVLDAPEMRLGGDVSTSSDGEQGDTGDAGDIAILAEQLLADGDITSSTAGSGDAGDIAIFAGQLLADGDIISSTEGSGSAGVIVLDAPEMQLGGDVSTSSDGAGDAGRVEVTAESLAIIGGRIASAASASGDSGDVSLQMRELRMQSGAISVQSNTGRSGSVDIDVATLEMTADSSISAESLGANAGSVLVSAIENMSLDNSSIVATTRATTPGNPADAVAQIRIDTPVLALLNGSEVAAETSGARDSGSITISGTGTANDATDRVTRVEVGTGSRVSTSSVGTGDGTGDAGDIAIFAEELLADGDIISSTAGSGSAGVIVLDAPEMQLGGDVSTSSDGAGDAGRVEVTAESLAIIGGRIASAASASGDSGNVSLQMRELRMQSGEISVQSNTGQSGSVDIDVTTLEMTAGSSISAESLGANAGSVLVSASESMSLDSSAIGATTRATTPGNPADAVAQIRIDTPVLALLNGSEVAAETSGARDSGSITISDTGTANDATDRATRVEVGTGSRVSTSSVGTGDGTGDAGDIAIFAEELLADGDIISSTAGSGSAGVIVLDAPEMQLGGDVSTSSDGTGNAGSIDVNADTLALLGGRIASEASGAGSSGNIALQLRELRIAGGSISVESNEGESGTIEIDAEVVEMTDGAEITAESLAASAGSIFVRAAQSLTMDGGVIRATTNAQTPAGPGDEVAEIGLDTAELRMTNESGILAETTGVRDSGSVTITGPGLANDETDAVAVLDIDETSSISTSAFGTNMVSGLGFNRGGIQLAALDEGLDDGVGEAGDILVYADKLKLAGNIASSTSGAGDAGSVTLRASDINISGGVATRSTGTGDAGLIDVKGDVLVITGNGSISSAAEGDANSGSVTVDVGEFLLQGGSITVESIDGQSGSITLSSRNLDMNDGANVSARSTGSAGGSITITVDDIIWMNDSQILASAQGLAGDDSGGNVTISGPEFIIMNRSLISGNANAGNGGEISMVTGTLIRSADSFITATSSSAVDGTVSIDSLNDLAATLLEIDPPDVDVPDPLDRRCTPAQLKSRSSLRIERVAPGAVKSVYLDGEEVNVPGGLAMVSCRP